MSGPACAGVARGQRRPCSSKFARRTCVRSSTWTRTWRCPPGCRARHVCETLAEFLQGPGGAV
eukprot:15474431-Alexandrium_andersonii.AAC.1